MEIKRRNFLKVAAQTALIIPNIILAKNVGIYERKLNLYHAATGEFSHETFWANGEYNLEAIVDISKFLKDIHTNEVYPIDINLINFVHSLQLKSDKRYSFIVNSGYRSESTNRRLMKTHNAVQNSFHKSGKALDLSIPRKARTDLNKLRVHASKMKLGGVGYYPHKNFMHIDSGYVRNWIT